MYNVAIWKLDSTDQKEYFTVLILWILTIKTGNSEFLKNSSCQFFWNREFPLELLKEPTSHNELTAISWFYFDSQFWGVKSV